MMHLYDSEGRHIANLDTGQLYSVSGRHVGAYMDDEGIFIDLEGRYLGEIVQNDRLLEDRTSPFHEQTFPVPPERATVTASAQAAQPKITLPERYADVDRRKL